MFRRCQESIVTVTEASNRGGERLDAGWGRTRGSKADGEPGVTGAAGLQQRSCTLEATRGSTGYKGGSSAMRRRPGRKAGPDSRGEESDLARTGTGPEGP